MAQDGYHDLTLREFVSQFRGITSTARQRDLTSSLPNIKRLSDFVINGDADSNLISRLLHQMSSLTKPVPPLNLGFIGEEHIRKVFGELDLKYVRKIGSNNNLPFVVEVAYIPDENLEGARFHFGLNFSPAASDPLADSTLSHDTAKEDFEGHGIKGIASRYKVNMWDKLHIVCNITYPRFRFKDRGKSILEIE